MAGGRADTPEQALQAAVEIGRRVLAFTSESTMEEYLANDVLQLAAERLLTMFGEALKEVPEATLALIDANLDWRGPKRFRDLTSHWYLDSMDHRLIWRAIHEEIPPILKAIEVYLASRPQKDKA